MFHPCLIGRVNDNKVGQYDPGTLLFTGINDVVWDKVGWSYVLNEDPDSAVKYRRIRNLWKTVHVTKVDLDGVKMYERAECNRHDERSTRELRDYLDSFRFLTLYGNTPTFPYTE